MGRPGKDGNLPADDGKPTTKKGLKVNIMLLINDILKTDLDGGEYIAHCTDGNNYEATYNAELKNMFFCIPADVEVLGYSKK